MAIIKKQNSDIIFFTERLEKKLNSMTEYPLTIAEAPTGYGKSTVIREYLNTNNINYIWFTVDSNDRNKFHKDFCERIKNVSEECSRQILAIGCPTSSDTAAKTARALMNIEFEEDTVLVIDNYHMVSDEYFNSVIIDISGNIHSRLKVVCITQAITSNLVLDLVLKKKLNYIGKEDFELSKDEIADYYKLCGIKLEDSEIEFLYKHTEGWISALYLQMLSYLSTNSFEQTFNIDNLVNKAIWDCLDHVEQDFFITMSVFESFTIRQAAYVYGEKMSENEIENLINKCGFIKYDQKERKYYIHNILMYFLENEFEKLEAVFRKQIYKSAGDWFRVNEKYFEAVCYYYKIKDYESILDMDYNLEIFHNINYKAYKQMFFDVIDKTPRKVKQAHLNTYLVYLFFLYVYNKRDLLTIECEDVKSMLEDADISEHEKNIIEGNLYFLMGLRHFNTISEMYQNYEKAYELLKSSTDIFSSMGSCTFNCPSIAALYHKNPGELDIEVDSLEKLMPLYYKLTDGKGKGQDVAFKAEELYLQGNFEDAEKLCNKALYMADTREELSIFICTQFLLAKISCFTAEYNRIKEINDAISAKIEENRRYDLLSMNDMCFGYVNILMDETDEVPAWLKSADTIEEMCTIYNLGFANLIYGRYLIQTENYDMLESLSGQMLSVAAIFDNVLYKIYTCIYLSVVKNARKDTEKARQLLIEAIDYAIKDGIVLPFVENYPGITGMISELEIRAEYSDFVKEIKKIAMKYAKGMQSVLKASKSNHSYGLTNRELEVAKLAAQRLSNKEIADTLFIAESTVKSNLKVVFNKLGINSRNDLKNFF